MDRILLGHLKMVGIADHLAPIADVRFDSASGLELLLTALAVYSQICCDFSGHSDLARGVSMLFAVDSFLRQINRHLPVQVLPSALRLRADHVIAEMLTGLGARVRAIDAPFDPEGGAYASHGHSHD